jgi:uncharacterized protein YbjT (DUF2867 family)
VHREDGRADALRAAGAEDVADVATAILADPEEHVGKLYELTGADSRDLTSLASEFSTALGRPVRYEDVPLDEWLEHDLPNAGLPEHVHEHIATMARLHSENRYDRVSPDIELVLGRPPRDLRAFLDSVRPQLAL